MNPNGTKPEGNELPGSGDESQQAAVIAQVVEALQGLKFGQVTILVQDGVVVQIERLERTRLKRRGEYGRR